ncbi:MAG: CRISPR-associated endonuclease Cas1 [Deltaproteobacteria bacterium]|nr:CRISPR-associated endonuclease Cas1 [Deltaproteobacteria bacterium]
MLNEFAYCPRLAYIEWVQQDFVDSVDTVEGRFQHRRVDQPGGELPDGGQTTEGRIHARSVELSAPAAGLIARIDLVEGEGTRVTPVDYKHGAPPDTKERAWEPERVQLCAQALILEENGFECQEGVLYFVGAKERVPVPVDEALRARTRALLADLRRVAAAGELPPPLRDSPKCPRCSLVGVCLPDEINLLRGADDEAPAGEPRRLLPARDDDLPLYVQAAGARVGKRGEELVVEERDGTKHEVRLGQTSQVALFGGVQITTQAVQELCGRGIPLAFFSHGGWFYGLTWGMTHKNVELRRLQFAAAGDDGRSLALARRFVAAKVRNCRTLLRRNAEAVDDRDLDRLKELVADVEGATSAATLLGLEGTAARIYFSSFGQMLRPPAERPGLDFDFSGRNRRPPRDPVNALLSFAYALLTKDFTVTLLAVGFDPFLGFYHRPRYGRPALALDLMEEFRPLIADSVVLSAVNTGVVKPADFVRRGAAPALAPAGRTRFLEAYERRMDELVTHPVFGYRVSYRRVLEVQARLLGRFLAGEIDEYPGFCTR